MVSTASSPLIAGTADNFAAVALAASHERLVLLDLWAPWCGPCKALAPILEDVARTEAARLHVVQVDVDAEPELATRFHVRALPTLLFLRQGEVVDRLVGLHSADAIRARLETLAGVTR